MPWDFQLNASQDVLLVLPHVLPCLYRRDCKVTDSLVSLKYFIELYYLNYLEQFQCYSHDRKRKRQFRDKFLFLWQPLNYHWILFHICCDKNFPTIRTNIVTENILSGKPRPVQLVAPSNVTCLKFYVVRKSDKTNRWQWRWSILDSILTIVSIDHFDDTIYTIILPVWRIVYGILGLKCISCCASFVGIKRMSQY